MIFARAGARLRGTRPRAQGWHLGHTKREEQWPVRIYQTENRCPVYAAAPLPLRRNLHERCARAGTEPAATPRSSIRARPPATAKASARACALFRRRNGGQVKRGPPSETSALRGARPSPMVIRWLADAQAVRRFGPRFTNLREWIDLPVFYAFADLATGRAVLDSQTSRNSSRFLSTYALASSMLA